MRALVIILLLSAGAAHAESRDARAPPTDPRARQLLVDGNARFKAGDYERAIEAYEAGARIQDVPVFELALGQSYRMLGKWVDAEAHFQRFIAIGHPSPKVLEGVAKLIDQVRTERAKETPPPPPPPPPSTPLTPTLLPLQAPAMTPPAPSPRVITEPWYRDRIGWGLTVAGTAGLVTGGYYLVTGAHRHNQAAADPSQTHRTALQDQAITDYKIAGIVGGIGATLAISSVVKFLIRPEHEVQVTVSSRAIALSTRF